MKADVGDRIVVASGTLHRPTPDGEVLQTGPDGGGPYLVRWSDSGNERPVLPWSGRTCRACPAACRRRWRSAASSRIGHGADRRNGRVEIDRYEDRELNVGQRRPAQRRTWRPDVRGEARRSPADPDMPAVGDEVAAARALRQLADHCWRWPPAISQMPRVIPFRCAAESPHVEECRRGIPAKAHSPVGLHALISGSAGDTRDCS